MAYQLDGSDPLVIFGGLAILIFLGFAGNLIFSKLKFNDTLILILIGVLVGPIFKLIPPESVLPLSGIIGPLALILILFDGGLALKFQELMGGLGRAAVLGVVGFIGTTAIVGAMTAVALQIPFTTGMILGAIVGGTSALVVLPSLANMDVAKKTGTTLSLESALTDVLVVVVSFTLIAIVAASSVAGAGQIDVDSDQDGLDDAWEEEHFGDLSRNGNQDLDEDGHSDKAEFEAGSNPDDPESRPTRLNFDAQGITSKLLITFAMSIFIGVAAGFAWLLLYPKVSDKPFGYMLTLGFMFFMYVFVEWILRDVNEGGGPLAVLAFGIILGNNQSLGAMGRRVGDHFGTGMKRFQSEINFLVRTFFFIFLGIIVPLQSLKDPIVLGIGLLLMLGIVGGRYLAVAATSRTLVPKGDDMVMLVMLPRGLAAAVLAALPFQKGIPGTEEFVALAFLLLVGTNLFSTVGALLLEKKGGDLNVGGPEASPAGSGGGASRSSRVSSGRAGSGRARQVADSSKPRTTKSSTTRTTRTASRTSQAGKRSSSTQRSLEGLGKRK